MIVRWRRVYSGWGLFAPGRSGPPGARSLKPAGRGVYAIACRPGSIRCTVSEAGRPATAYTPARAHRRAHVRTCVRASLHRSAALAHANAHSLAHARMHLRAHTRAHARTRSRAQASARSTSRRSTAGGPSTTTYRREREGERGEGRRVGGGRERESCGGGASGARAGGRRCPCGLGQWAQTAGGGGAAVKDPIVQYMQIQYRICMVYALYALPTLLRDLSFPLLSYPSRTVRRQQRRPVAFWAFAGACTYHPNMCIQKMNILESIRDIFVYSLHIEIFESILIANSFSIFLPMFCILFA